MHHAAYIILSPNTQFCLHLPFLANAPESLKIPSTTVFAIFRFGALKPKEFCERFCYRQLCYAIHKP